MNLNINQLQSILEIDRARSISQAAANLYMAQSNLSRILRETETAVGFRIFERTRRGISPTEQGKQFLLRAENILKDVAYIEEIGHLHSIAPKISLCIPHSYSCMHALIDYLHKKQEYPESQISIRECAPSVAIESVVSCAADFSVIRFFSEYCHYYEQQFRDNGLQAYPLSRSLFRITVSENSPLAALEVIDPGELGDYICISSMAKNSPSRLSNSKTRISVTDRMAQVQILQSVPASFLWAEPLPDEFLKAHHLVQLPSIIPIENQTVLLCRQDEQYPDTVLELMEWIRNGNNQ